jgi:hypothetical protein
MSVHDRIPPNSVISMLVAQGRLLTEPSGTQHSGQIDGNGHPIDHHLGASLNRKTAAFIQAKIVASTTHIECNDEANKDDAFNKIATPPSSAKTGVEARFSPAATSSKLDIDRIFIAGDQYGITRSPTPAPIEAEHLRRGRARRRQARGRHPGSHMMRVGPPSLPRIEACWVQDRVEPCRCQPSALAHPDDAATHAPPQQ